MRRRTGILFIFGAAIPLAIFASTAWACGTLTTLKAAPSSAAAGQTVSATGVNYSSSIDFTPVSIRWDSRTGPVLKEIMPEQNGRFSTTVQIPASASAGDHILIATQNRKADGAPKSGTPGRTMVRVPGAAASATLPASPWSEAKPGGPGGSGATAGAGESGYSPFLAIGLSLGLLTVGLALVGRGRGRGSRREPLGA